MNFLVLKAQATDLVKVLKNLDFGLGGLVQVSMYRPNVNLLTHRKLDEFVYYTYGYKLLNIGSCGSHQIQYAFRCSFNDEKIKVDGTVHLGSDWKLLEFF
mgnify:CR=1 FL=1